LLANIIIGNGQTREEEEYMTTSTVKEVSNANMFILVDILSLYRSIITLSLNPATYMLIFTMLVVNLIRA